MGFLIGGLRWLVLSVKATFLKGAKFCNECGLKIRNGLSRKCGKNIPPDSKFCLECGHELRKSKERPGLRLPATPILHPETPGSKNTDFSRSSIEGERKLVTVMFADVAGFTAISGELDPEDVHRIMDGCCRILVDEIHRLEGTIGEFRGDGVMALFGAPIAHEDHAQRGCHPARAIQQARLPYGEEIKRELRN